MGRYSTYQKAENCAWVNYMFIMNFIYLIEFEPIEVDSNEIHMAHTIDVLNKMNKLLSKM